jgi:hypothetical protein
MILGALEIIYGVEAGLVHPLHLPETQGPERFSYIVIAYDDSPDVYDILFVRNGKVEEYAGLHHDLRTILKEESVRAALDACALRCRVYLFSVSRQGFERFLLTFRSVPSVNVMIDRLSRKQLSALLAGTGCRNGILEVDSPSFPFPLIELSRFTSADELLNEAHRHRRGRMMVYDLELNSLLRNRAKEKTPVHSRDERHEHTAKPDEKTGDDAVPGETWASPEDPAKRNDDQRPGTSSQTSPPERDAEEQIVTAFAGALAEFRHAVKGDSGRERHQWMDRIVSRFFHSPPPLGIDRVTLSNAPVVLEAIEQGVRTGMRYRRDELAAEAKRILKGLYDTKGDLLRSYGLEQPVQECYRRLGGIIRR